MPANKHMFIGLHITDRMNHVGAIQKVLTEYGCSIKTRLGLHDCSENFCSPNGILILEISDTQEKFDSLVASLEAIEGVEAKTMVFDHP